MVSASDVRELLEDRPDLEPAIEALLEPEPPWAFDDVAIDSGQFGELVSRDLVTKTPEGYHVTNRQAITTALDRDDTAETPDSSLKTRITTWPRVDRPAAVGLVAVLAAVIGFRIIAWPMVFKSGDVVLAANDPYYYRYWVDSLLATPAFDGSVLPSGVTKGEPLLVVSLWLMTRLVGGSVAMAGYVLAWYPIVAAIFTACLVYAASVLVTDDRRIGLAATGLLAVLPAHAFRTSLGFADHHPFDYLWLTVTLFGLVFLARTTTRDSPLSIPAVLTGVLTVGLGISAQTLSWDNSPIILAVLGPYVLLDSLRAAATRQSPLRTTGPALLGMVLASGVVWRVHESFGWHTELVAATPLLLALGGFAVVATAELAYRVNLPTIALAAGQALVGTGGVIALRRVRPEYWSRGITSVESRLLAERPIAEVHSIFDQSFGWLLLFGFILLLALPYLAWASARAIEDARYLPLIVYAWYFLGLAAIQARFVGELAPSLVVFAGVGVVHLAERIDLTDRPVPFEDHNPHAVSMPSAHQFSYIILLFLLITGLGILQVGVKTDQIATPHGQSDTAFYLANYSTERGYEAPENYVFSRWGANRAYNYFVNGDSKSYGYARSNYIQFLTATDPASWYDRLSPRRFVVVSSRASQTNRSQLGARLYPQNANPPDADSGLAHYRLVYVSPEGQLKAYELVAGAVLAGQSSPNKTIRAETSVTVPGTSFSYSIETTADAEGNYSVRAPYPGSYAVGGQRVTVSEQAVYNGSTIPIER